MYQKSDVAVATKMKLKKHLLWTFSDGFYAINVLYKKKKNDEPLKNQKIKSHDNLINLFTFITVSKGYYFP